MNKKRSKLYRTGTKGISSRKILNVTSSDKNTLFMMGKKNARLYARLHLIKKQQANLLL
jgi:hypothetical protein